MKDYKDGGGRKLPNEREKSAGIKIEEKGSARERDR